MLSLSLLHLNWVLLLACVYCTRSIFDSNVKLYAKMRWAIWCRANVYYAISLLSVCRILIVSINVLMPLLFVLWSLSPKKFFVEISDKSLSMKSHSMLRTSSNLLESKGISWKWLFIAWEVGFYLDTVALSFLALPSCRFRAGLSSPYLCMIRDAYCWSSWCTIGLLLLTPLIGLGMLLPLDCPSKLIMLLVSVEKFSPWCGFDGWAIVF